MVLEPFKGPMFEDEAAEPNPILRFKEFIKQEPPDDSTDFEYAKRLLGDLWEITHIPTGNRAYLEVRPVEDTTNTSWYFKVFNRDGLVIDKCLGSSDELYRYLVHGKDEYSLKNPT